MFVNMIIFQNVAHVNLYFLININEYSNSEIVLENNVNW